ncbi:MAG: Rpn family recombination-promoting nuclease/putative transposase, partial [Clostridiales bacterium]|nr:Rpn family recombination-promoting nuclease/putative transposase [Clostridiales bacterium]
AQQNRKEKNLKPGAEYLSGLRKGDKLTPVITAVIYTGSEPWDGPLCLHDMLDFADEEQKAFVPDYPLNIISAADLDDSEFTKFHTEIGYALKLLKHKDKDADKVIEERKHEKVSPETAFFLKGAANLDLEFEIEDGGVDMCASLERKYKEKEQQTKVLDIKNLMESMKWTAEQAMNALKIPSDQRSMYAGMVNKK